MPIPPLPDSRMRSIVAWLESYRPKDYRRMKASGTLDQYAKELDQQMWEEYLQADDDVLNELHEEKIQGTEEGLVQYPTRLRARWEEIFHRYLPTRELPDEEEEGSEPQ